MLVIRVQKRILVNVELRWRFLWGEGNFVDRLLPRRYISVVVCVELRQREAALSDYGMKGISLTDLFRGAIFTR